MSRKVAFSVPAGSKNYNVNDQNSDDDMKTYLYPTFDDLFTNRDIVKVDKATDHEYHDVRKLPMMLWKANINFIETLFPYRVETTSDLYTDLSAIREDIARMNLPYLYDACFGMYYRKMKEFDRDMNYVPVEIYKSEEAAAEWKRKLHKHGATGFRCIDFLHRYQKSDFKDFQGAIRYGDDEDARAFILKMRSGEISLSDMGKMMQIKQEAVENDCREVYKSQKADEKTKVKVENIVKHHVKKQLIQEIVKVW